MDARMRASLDRHITGNFGEDQFKDDEPDDDSPAEQAASAHERKMEAEAEAALAELALDLQADGERIRRLDESTFECLNGGSRPIDILKDVLIGLAATQELVSAMEERVRRAIAQIDAAQELEPPKLLDDTFVGFTVSTGTLRAVDLITAYLEMLEQHWPAKASRILSLLDDEWPMVSERSYPNLSEAMVDHMTARKPELVDGLLSDLAEALDEIAPDGCYFGSIEGDGAEIGFWTHPDTPVGE